MNWKLLFLLSLLGLGIAFATVFHFNQKMEQFIWLPVFICSGYFIFRFGKRKFFLHGFLLGWFNCCWVILVHLFMFSSLVGHHKEVALFVSQLPAGISPKLSVAILEILKWVFLSLISGIFGFVVSKGMEKVSE